MEEIFLLNVYFHKNIFNWVKLGLSILPHGHTQNNLRTTEGKKCIFLTSIYKRTSIKKNVKETLIF